MNKSFQWVIRVIAVLAILFSLQRAWAGVSFYQGRLAFKSGDDASKLQALQRLDSTSSNPHYDMLVGRLSYGVGLREANPRALEQAISSFEDLTFKIPLYGRAWLYLGLAKLEHFKLNRGRFDRGAWEGVKENLKKAVEHEPGSAWIAFTVGSQYVNQEPNLTETERRESVELLRKSIQIHFANPDFQFLAKPSPYLLPILNMLWNAHQNLDLMKGLVPNNPESYRVFLDFLKSKRMWKEYEGIYPAYIQLVNRSYRKQCEQGTALLNESEFEDAYRVFRKAFWMQSWSYYYAKTGLLIAENVIEPIQQRMHSLFKEDYYLLLQRVLEEEDQSLKDLYKFLGPLVQGTRDPYLNGLFSYRIKRYKPAKSYFEKDEAIHPRRNYFLARSYWELGYKEKARSLLRPALVEDKPDMRDLLALLTWMNDKSLIKRKIQEQLILKKDASEWWSKSFSGSKMDHKGTSTMTVNLLPGYAKLHIYLKGRPSGDGEYGFVRVLVNGKPKLSYYVNHRYWAPIPLNIKTAGGIRWIQVEYLNDRDADEWLNPEVDLGPVKIEYLKDAAEFKDLLLSGE